MTTANRQLRVTERDIEILAALAEHRFLTTAQLTARYFPSQPTAQRRMRDLHRTGLVHRLYLPARPHNRSTSTVYGLARQGAQHVAHATGEPVPAYLTRHDQRSGLFLDHTLRRNDLHLCLELLAERRGDVELVRWHQRRDDVHAQAVVQERRRSVRVPLVPDGVAVVEHLGTQHILVVEVDLGTVRRERMRLRYAGYLAWWRNRRAERRFGPHPVRVLTLTANDRRLRSLRAAARTTTPGSVGSALFWFATLDVLDLNAPERLLDATWRTARDDHLHPLFTTPDS